MDGAAVAAGEPGHDTTTVNVAQAQSLASGAVPITVDNFMRAESDMSSGALYKEGGIGKFQHRREPSAIDKQSVIWTDALPFNRLCYAKPDAVTNAIGYAKFYNRSRHL